MRALFTTIEAAVRGMSLATESRENAMRAALLIGDRQAVQSLAVEEAASAAVLELADRCWLEMGRDCPSSAAWDIRGYFDPDLRPEEHDPQVERGVTLCQAAAAAIWHEEMRQPTHVDILSPWQGDDAVAAAEICSHLCCDTRLPVVFVCDGRHVLATWVDRWQT